MDLRSIINADASSASRSQAPPSHSYPIKQSPQEYDINQSDYVSPKAYHGGLYARPAQPPPLQPPVHGDFRSPGHSSSHMTAQSPHSYTPTSSLSGNQYPFPLNTMQSASQSQPLQHYPQRDNHTPSTKSSQPYRHPSPSLHTSSTTTPGSSHGYSQNQRSHSTHSTTTPTSAQSQAPHNHRESPLSASSQTHPYHLYPHQHHSQPGTPLGPPSSYHRSRPSLHQEHSGSFEHQRSQSGGSLTTVQSQGQSPIADGQGRIAASPTCYHLSQPPLASQEYLTDQERERSLSVSPKTKLPSQTRQDSMESRQGGYNTWGERVLPANQMQVEPLAPAPDIQPANHDFKNRSVEYTMNNNGNQVQPLVRHLDLVNGGQHVPPTPYGATSIGVMNRGLLDLAPSQEQQRINTVSPTSTADGLGPQYRKDMSRPGSRDQPNSASSSVTPLPQQPTTPQPCSNQHNPNFQSSPANIVPQQLASAAATTSGPSPPSHPSMQISGSKRDADAITSTAGSPMQPTSKRPRHDEPPIFARKASRSTSNSPLLPNKRQSGPRGAVLVKQEPQDLKPAVAQMPMPALVKEESNGHPPQPPSNEVALPKAQPELAGPGPLGPWEPSILNLIPSEEVTRVISDFLFTQVVLRDDVGAGPAGGGPGQGAVLEIEAKIGQLIDKNTNDRLRLPVMSECVVSKDDPNVRINFKSSMTEASSLSQKVILRSLQFCLCTVTTPFVEWISQQSLGGLAATQTTPCERSSAI